MKKQPPGHYMTGVAYEPPADIGPNPADVVAARCEARFVRERRASRVSWSNIAKMLGVEQAGLQDRYRGVIE